jgi:hypothetical protein
LSGQVGLAGRRPAVAVSASAVGLALVGAGLFGLVHIVGNTWRGNPRAATFGWELSAVSFALLAGLGWLLRRDAGVR